MVKPASQPCNWPGGLGLNETKKPWCNIKKNENALLYWSYYFSSNWGKNYMSYPLTKTHTNSQTHPHLLPSQKGSNHRPHQLYSPQQQNMLLVYRPQVNTFWYRHAHRKLLPCRKRECKGYCSVLFKHRLLKFITNNSSSLNEGNLNHDRVCTFNLSTELYYFLCFLHSLSFHWADISNTQDSVSTHFQHFLFVRCLDCLVWKTVMRLSLI